jgi:short subunit dehydrogenase-like uncharacterized protein
MPAVIIYGATGYTGGLITNLAVSTGLVSTGLAPIVAGRNGASLQILGSSLGIEHRVFGLDSQADIDTGLSGTKVLLNCAGPYHRTAEILIDACIRNGINYVDIAAELDSYNISIQRHQEAVDAGVMLLPGCGGSVAMLGCLAGLAVASVVDPVCIDIGMYVAGPMSRGSLASAGENMGVTLWSDKMGS